MKFFTQFIIYIEIIYSRALEGNKLLEAYFIQNNENNSDNINF